MKGNDEVIQGFNDMVNMTSSELEKWLKSSDSNSAGWPKDDGDGESVGHDSGRKIVEILKANPQKKPDEYTDDQIEHMRKVVAYCKRHLAQESAGNDKKSPEELKKTKSYASLKNWGHDALKERKGNKKDNDEAEAGDKRARQDDDEGGKKVNKTAKNSSVKDEKNDKDDEEAEEDDEDEDFDDEEEEEEESDEDADEDEEQETKRKTRSSQNGQQKNGKQQNGKQENSKRAKSESENGDKQRNGEKKENGEQKQNGKQDKPSSGGKNGEPKPGEKVSWNWGGGQPEGKVLDVKHEKTSIETKNGNEVSRDGSDKDPAVVLDTGKSKAIKSAHELN